MHRHKGDYYDHAHAAANDRDVAAEFHLQPKGNQSLVVDSI
jgi:hypothetical protein